MSPWQRSTGVAVHAYSPRMPPCRPPTRQDAVGADSVGKEDGRHRAPRRSLATAGAVDPGPARGFAAGYEPRTIRDSNAVAHLHLLDRRCTRRSADQPGPARPSAPGAPPARPPRSTRAIRSGGQAPQRHQGRVGSDLVGEVTCLVGAEVGRQFRDRGRHPEQDERGQPVLAEVRARHLLRSAI